MSKIGIVVPVLNNFQGAVAALESVKTSHSWEPIILSQWRENKPLSAAWNAGVDIALNRRGCDFALVVNDDILFTPCTIDNLVKEFEDAPDNVVMMTAVNNRGYIDSQGAGPEWTLIHPHIDTNGIFNEHPDFSCFMINKKTVDLVGKFDENFIPAYFEDNDFHYRVKLTGLIAGSASSAPYYHYASQTVKPPEFHQWFENNRNYYVKKWGGLPGQETFSYPFNNINLTPKDI